MPFVTTAFAFFVTAWFTLRSFRPRVYIRRDSRAYSAFTKVELKTTVEWLSVASDFKSRQYSNDIGIIDLTLSSVSYYGYLVIFSYVYVKAIQRNFDRSFGVGVVPSYQPSLSPSKGKP